MDLVFSRSGDYESQRSEQIGVVDGVYCLTGSNGCWDITCAFHRVPRPSREHQDASQLYIPFAFARYVFCLFLLDRFGFRVSFLTKP